MSSELDKSKPKYRYLILHLLCWSVLIVVPLFFHSSNDDWLVVLNRYLRWLGNPLAYLLVFYINYLWLVPRLLLKKSDWKLFLLANLLVIAGGLLLMDVWHWLVVQFLPEVTVNGPKRPFVRFPRYFWAVVTLILIIALAMAVRIVQRWQHIEEARKEADQGKAQTAVGELSKLLRHVLYENQQDFVPLCKEADFMRNYIELMKIRVTDNVKINTNINVQPNDSTPVAPLIFISLIENAFKHGISPQGKGEISIDLNQADGDITCEIHNTCYPKRENDKSGSGIGLDQVSRRLELMYPDRYTWEKGKTADGGQYYSKITIKKDKS